MDLRIVQPSLLEGAHILLGHVWKRIDFLQQNHVRPYFGQLVDASRESREALGVGFDLANPELTDLQTV